MRLIDLTGQRFSHLVVLRRLEGASHNAKWECQCDCGSLTHVRGAHLKSGATNSCRCYRLGSIGKRSRLHGMGNSREYHSWNAAKGRCHNPKNAKFARYGGRGIVVCDHWLWSFPNFLSDMGPCPPDCTLNRIDNDGPYSPDNCEWATAVTQANNRRSSRVIRIGDREMTIAQAASEFGIGYWTLKRRLNEGVEPARAILPETTRKHHWITIGGETMSLSDAARKHGLKPMTLLARIARGVPPEVAARQPLRNHGSRLASNLRRRQG